MSEATEGFLLPSTAGGRSNIFPYEVYTTQGFAVQWVSSLASTPNWPLNWGVHVFHCHSSHRKWRHSGRRYSLTAFISGSSLLANMMVSICCLTPFIDFLWLGFSGKQSSTATLKRSLNRVTLGHWILLSRSLSSWPPSGESLAAWYRRMQFSCLEAEEVDKD